MSSVATAPATVALDELLRHNEEETARWRGFFEKNPAALDVTWQSDVADVRQMVRHIFAVELLYAEVIHGTARAQIVYDDFRFATLDELFATHEQARELLRATLASALEWHEQLTFGGGERTWSRVGTRRKMFLHAMFHSMRHWAQLATVLRQAGFKQDWQHDFIFSQVME